MNVLPSLNLSLTCVLLAMVHFTRGQVHGTVVSDTTGKRDDSSGASTGQALQSFLATIENALKQAQTGEKGLKLKKAMEDVVDQAEKILQWANVSISGEEIESVISEVSKTFLWAVNSSIIDKEFKLKVALQTLRALANNITTDNSDLYEYVSAIQWVAEVILESIQDPIVNDLKTNGQTTVNRNEDNGQAVIKRQFFHTWNHGGGSNTRLGLDVTGIGGKGGIDGSLTGSHTFRNDLNVNGKINYNNGQLGLGLGASKTFKHPGGSSTTFQGGVDLNGAGKPSYNLGLTHTFRKKNTVKRNPNFFEN